VNVLNAVRKKLLRAVAKNCPGRKVRNQLLRWCGYRIGKKVYIGEDLIIVDDLFEGGTGLFIGDRAAIAPRVTFVLDSAPNWSRIRDHVNTQKGSIHIGQDAWIGAGAVILPEVSIGEGAVVGANSVVLKDVEAYAIVGGIPARKIKTIAVPWRSDGAEGQEGRTAGGIDRDE
jgi:acetyltransferase-like isoleucine patch superfamily enzyme